MAEKRIETVEMRAGDVKTGFGNPRKITKKKKDELRNSIETFGDFGSFIIDENDNIIGGNMRLSVIKEMDPDTIILCKRLIGYSETELRAINIKDNADCSQQCGRRSFYQSGSSNGKARYNSSVQIERHPNRYCGYGSAGRGVHPSSRRYAPRPSDCCRCSNGSLETEQKPQGKESPCIRSSI